MIMRQSFFFGNHNGIGSEEREYIADSIINFLKVASNKWAVENHPSFLNVRAFVVSHVILKKGQVVPASLPRQNL